MAYCTILVASGVRRETKLPGGVWAGMRIVYKEIVGECETRLCHDLAAK